MMDELQRIVIRGSQGYLAVFEQIKREQNLKTDREAYQVTESIYESVMGRPKFENTGFDGFRVLKYRVSKRLLSKSKSTKQGGVR